MDAGSGSRAGRAADVMRVAFGGTALLAPLTGIGQYAYHLAQGLAAHPDVELACFNGRAFDHEVRVQQPRIQGRARALLRRWLPGAYALRRGVEQLRFDAGRRKGFDVYHEPNYLALRFDGPTVITVHDLSWRHHAQTHPPERVRAMERHFPDSLRRASVVLTDSAFVRDELLAEFSVAPERVIAVPLGLDPVFRPMTADETAPVLQPLALAHGGYFLCIGTLEPRKNLHAAIAAYAALPPDIRRKYPMVLAGAKGWRTTALEQVLAPLVESGEVRLLGYVSRAELASVLAGALALVYPSLYEGFGLPPLEAMGCGVPPLISTAGALVEVAGPAGVAVQAQDVEGLSAAMRRMVEDPALRADLSARGLERAAGFTWDACVQRTLDAYRFAVSNSR